MNDANAKGDFIAILGLEDSIGTDVSRREVDAIDKCGALGIAPVDIGTRALAACSLSVEFTIVACRPDCVCSFDTIW